MFPPRYFQQGLTQIISQYHQPLFLLSTLSSRLNSALIFFFPVYLYSIYLSSEPHSSSVVVIFKFFWLLLLIIVNICCYFLPRNGLWVFGSTLIPDFLFPWLLSVFKRECFSLESTLGKLSFNPNLLSQWRLSFCQRRSIAFSRSITICLKYRISKQRR